MEWGSKVEMCTFTVYSETCPSVDTVAFVATHCVSTHVAAIDTPVAATRLTFINVILTERTFPLDGTATFKAGQNFPTCSTVGTIMADRVTFVTYQRYLTVNSCIICRAIAPV